jgi:ribosomal protein L12E/L44/L45/RPP1/RPP2
MSLSQKVMAAIGEVAVETTQIEWVMAILITRVEQDDIMEVLKQDGSKLAKRAKQAAARLNNAEMVERTQAWLKEAEGFRSTRNQILHSIAAKTHSGWIAYHPRGETFREYKTPGIVDLAARVSRCAAEGENMAREWPRHP